MTGLLPVIFFRLLRSTPLLALIALALFSRSALAGTSVSSARIWPAQDYTRLVLESNQPIAFKYFSLKNPERLVIDLRDVELGDVLKEATRQVEASDPYIQQLRAGVFKPGIVRLVLDLKTEIKPSVFTLPPFGEYSHRLVVDVYPLHPPEDPLLALLQEREKLERESMPSAVQPQEALKPGPTVKPVEQPQPQKPPTHVRRLIIIAIDAGHGGEDPGARGKSGTREKDITLAIARKLKARMESEPDMRAVMIRDGDYFVRLDQRVAKARKINADLFVSIHADAYIKRHARGSSVFALSERGATSTAAKWLAKQENASDLIGGVKIGTQDPYLAQTLLDLSQTATISDSLKLGKEVLAELEDINTLHKPHVEQAGFAVLKSPDIPSILVETAFISNPEEEEKLKDEAYQDKMADAIFSGVKQYLSRNPPLAKTKLALEEQ